MTLKREAEQRNRDTERRREGEEEEAVEEVKRRRCDNRRFHTFL